MKNFILSAAMILIVLFAFSFSGSNVMVTKPITPKSTVIVDIDSDWRPYVRQGYQIHLISEGSSGRGHIVLVKY